MWKKVVFAISLFFFSNAWAGPYDPIVSMAWVGESIPGQNTATLQLNLTTMKAVKLLSVTSPVAESIEIHKLMMSRGKMKLHVVNSLPLPERQNVAFGTGGLYLMLTGIKQPLKIGDHVPLNLKFSFPDKQTKTITVEAEVRKMELSYKHLGPNEVYDHR